jgi:hypothetical protein
MKHFDDYREESRETAVLLMAFNRPKQTQQVWNAIEKQSPKRVYISLDGPRKDKASDLRNVEVIKKMVENPSWDCKIQFRFSDHNLGCKQNVIAGISWFFDQEEEGIILEDDCVPHPDFFVFCHLLLNQYRYDMRVGSISGTNMLGKFPDVVASMFRANESYTYARNAWMWGWASWRRAWKNYDGSMWNLDQSELNQIMKGLFTDKYERNFWGKKMANIINNKYNTWDYQWIMTHWLYSMVCIIPKNNFITNIGYSGEGTFTGHLSDRNPLALIPHQAQSNQPFEHPKFLFANQQFDQLALKLAIKPTGVKRLQIAFHDLMYRLASKNRIT